MGFRSAYQNQEGGGLCQQSQLYLCPSKSTPAKQQAVVIRAWALGSWLVCDRVIQSYLAAHMS